MQKVILHICNDYPYTKLYLNLVRNLSGFELKQVVYAPVKDSNAIGNNQDKTLTEVTYFYSNIIKLYHRFLYHLKIKTIQKDIISKIDINQVSITHAHTLFSNGGSAYLLKKNFNIPYIVAIRNTDVNAFFKYMFHLRKFGIEIMKNADAVIFISPAYKETVFKKYLPVHLHNEIQKKTFIIPNGISGHWLENNTKKKSFFKDGKIHLLFVGEMTANKNIPTIIKIAAKLNAIIPTELKIVGVPKDESAKIFALIEKNKTIVKYVAPIYDKEILMHQFREADIFIMPSYTETFGLVYIEALSQGVPVIFTKGQGIDGYFEEGQVGYSMSPTEINRAVENILKIKDQIEELSENATNEAQQFSWDIISDKYFSLYKQILSTKIVRK